MSAAQLLKKYGYIEGPPGAWTPARPSSEVWVQVPEEEGWFCFQRASGPLGGEGKPWGKEVPEMPGYVQIPFKQAEAFAQVSGLHPGEEAHQGFFEWVWPESRLVEIYEHSAAMAPEGQAYVKSSDEEGNIKYELVEVTSS
jgi:hypothetical protein